jgi:hypothetical protein
MPSESSEKTRELTVFLFEKVGKAMDVLVTDPNDARHRVWSSAKYLLMLRSESAPDSVHEDIEWIRHMLLRHQAENGLDSLRVTFTRTRNTTASKIAERVFEVYIKLAKIVHEWR